MLTWEHEHRQRRLVLGGRYRDRGGGSFLRTTASTTWMLTWLLVFVSACLPPPPSITASTPAALLASGLPNRRAVGRAASVFCALVAL